ncbi:MAG: PAC2 family protein, partial [Bifidobacteriaceae bacterium]|nr:PAC2 family protein [Bifidobacteriaceae bacterium]
YHQPQLAIDLVHDAAGSPFLLMYGPEPDIRWEAFTDAVIEVVEIFDVRLAVGMHGIPATAPHTRDWKVTGPAQAGELVARFGGSPAARVQLPGSAMALTELKLREVGREAQTFAVHVPHYLAQMPSPMGTVELMRAIGSAAGLDFGLAGIEEAAEVQRRQLDKQVAEQPELAAAIAKMEEAHDSRQPGPGFVAPGGELLAEKLPTGEELAAEFERFLADQGGDGDGPAFTV